MPRIMPLTRSRFTVQMNGALSLFLPNSRYTHGNFAEWKTVAIPTVSPSARMQNGSQKPR